MLRLFPLLIVSLISYTPLFAADNELTPEEKKDGWVLLFNGKNHDGWMNSNGKPIVSKIEDGALQVFKCGGYLLATEKQYDDFVLKCDVKMDAPCNSGIFLRVEDLKNPAHTGFEIQVCNPDEKEQPIHRHGSLYDIVIPKIAAANAPGEWDRFEIRFTGSELTVRINDKEVIKTNLDAFDSPGKRSVEGDHKFKRDDKPSTLKDFARTGYIGFQDHGHRCWYKNVKLLPLNAVNK